MLPIKTFSTVYIKLTIRRRPLLFASLVFEAAVRAPAPAAAAAAPSGAAAISAGAAGAALPGPPSAWRRRRRRDRRRPWSRKGSSDSRNSTSVRVSLFV